LKTDKEFGITSKKGENFSDWYSQVVLKTELIDYGPSKGFIVLRPYGYSIWESIKQIIDTYLKDSGHQDAFLPAIIPESLLRKEEEHFSGFSSEVFWITKAGEGQLAEKLALRPTSETIAYSLFADWIESYRELPLKLNFWNSAMRAEIKSTRPFIRNSEFLWQEGHTVHSNKEEAEKEVEFIINLYEKVLSEYMCIPVLKGYKSDKEKFVGAVSTKTLEAMMPDGKALQLATSHNLGQNFSIPFEIKFLGSDNVEHFAWQTSWGISWRLIGATIMIHGDDRGLILPPRIAPIQVVVVPIYRNDQAARGVLSASREIALELRNSGVKAHLDDRDEFTAGWKFNDWEKRGVPLRINIGLREISKGELEAVRRDTMEKQTIKRSDLVARVIELMNLIHYNLLKKAKDFLIGSISEANSLEVFKELIQKQGGFVSAPWCGDQKCEISIKEITGADIRLIAHVAKDSLIPKNCIFCGNEGISIPIFARAY
jgi:prolyl-tRNA synthetase